MAERNIGDEIIHGLTEALEYTRGRKIKAKVNKVVLPEKIDVRAIRENLKLSRNEFAHNFGFSPRTIQHWEQGDRTPQGSAKILLTLLERDPNAVARILWNRTAN